MLQDKTNTSAEPNSKKNDSANVAISTAALADKKQDKIAINSTSIPLDPRPATLNLILTPAPLPKIAFYENPVFLAATIGFFGVALTFFLGWKRMIKELSQTEKLASDGRDYSREQANKEREHSASEAHNERIATSRRTVYLETARQIVKSHEFLGTLINHPIAEIDIQAGLNELAVAVSQIAILGEMGTILKSREVQNLINQTFLRAIVFSIPIASTKDEIATHTKNRENENSAIAIIQAELNDLAQRRDFSIKSAHLERELEKRLASVAKYSSDIAAEQTKLSQQKMSYLDFIFHELLTINTRTDELIVMVRRELGLKTDEAALAQSTQDTEENIKHAISDLKTSLNQYL